jgi:hypothetical protein
MALCAAEGNFSIDGRERVVVHCTLPAGHEDWHQYSEDGWTQLTWQGDRPIGAKDFSERVLGR